MFNLVGFIKGFLIEDELDRSKQLAFEIDPSASPNTRTTFIAAQTADRTIMLPDSNFDFNSVLTETSTNTLTNKTIDADVNTISNIDNNEIKAAAAIDLTKLAALTANRVLQSDGSGFIAASAVTNTTLAFLDATSSIQTQLNAKVDDTDIIDLTHGGTGQTTANTSLNALLPSQTANGGKFLTTNGTNTSWASATAPGVLASNLLLNSDFSIWQRQTSRTGITGNLSSYLSDRWWISLENGGIATANRQPGTLDGSKYAFKIFYTSGGGGTIALKIGQQLENLDSLKVYNKNVSFSCYVKAVAAVTTVTVAVIYNDVGDFTQGTVISSQNFTVNSSSFTLCKVENVSIGTLPTTVGTVGVRISTAQTATNNGFILEQAMFNIGATSAEYQRKYADIATELEGCQRFYEKSSDQDVFVSNALSQWGGAIQYHSPEQSTPRAIKTSIPFNVSKFRQDSTIELWNPASGTANQAANRSGGLVQSISASSGDVGEHGFMVNQATVVNNQHYAFHWTANGEMN